MNGKNNWVPVLLIGGALAVAAGVAIYFVSTSRKEEAPETIVNADKFSPLLVEPNDPQYQALVEYYRQQQNAPFNIYTQILPQSDVLHYDPQFGVWRYKWGIFPGYDPSPYQRYSLPPQWGTDDLWFDPFGQRFSDFDI